MLRILSWSSGLGCDKAHSSDYDMVAPKDTIASPISNLSVPISIKRKRSPSVDGSSDRMSSQSFPTTTASQDISENMQTDSVRDNRPCQDPAVVTTAAATMTTPPVKAQPTVLTSQARLDKMRQTISSQLSLEILVKHKELRLIDQEMAKCQVALEQLRRCTEIPFPSMQSPSELVSQGRGPAVRQLGQRYPPESPAAWGVTDGPYSRHYAKWLLPDRRFDGGEPEPELTTPASAVSTSGRSTRGYYVDVLAGKTVKSRSRHGGNLQALPAGYGQPKEKATGPMILKRKSDGAMVKLVCPDCGRHDFGSAQGFINHCRIGHSRSFASHDAAAEACGEPVEYNANGSIKGLEPVISNAGSNTSVHPLVRSAKLLPESSPVSPCLKSDYVPGHLKSKAAPPKPLSSEFQASNHTPHLSALIKNQGLGLDLQHLVTDAKTKVETSESDGSDDEMDVDSPVPATGGRHPQVAGSKQPSKSSMSHVSSALLKSSIRTGLGSRDAASQQSIEQQHPVESFSGVLPSPTNESTQAPSLVDDDEDFDPQSPVSSAEIDEPDVDFEVHDDDHGDRGPRFQDLTSQPAACSPSPATTAPAVPTTRADVQEPDKHVTFVNPNPTSEGSDRKRRKI